jgi:hypothetical protein
VATSISWSDLFFQLPFSFHFKDTRRLILMRLRKRQLVRTTEATPFIFDV